MDGHYLGSNIAPLKVIGDGVALIEINDLLSHDNFEGVELAAYSIRDSESRIVCIDCLYKKYSRHTDRDIFYFRSFDLYRLLRRMNDGLKITAEHGIGITDYEMNYFMELREFYLQQVEVKA